MAVSMDIEAGTRRQSQGVDPNMPEYYASASETEQFNHNRNLRDPVHNRMPTGDPLETVTARAATAVFLASGIVLGAIGLTGWLLNDKQNTMERYNPDNYSSFIGAVQPWEVAGLMGAFFLCLGVGSLAGLADRHAVRNHIDNGRS